METTDSASSCFEPMRQSEIRCSSSPTYAYGGNDGHSASSFYSGFSCSEQPSPNPPIVFRPPDKSINQTFFIHAPEKKLTLFALHLAIIEKSASALGQLAFIWATTVLLGGFASALKPKDFWFVTIILIIEGARLFSRSSELKWQRQSTRTLPEELSVLKTINHLLYWLQLFAAVVCVALSLMRLGQQDYGEDAEINEKSALNVFYGLALAAALMFLLETGYWTWKIRLRKLLEQVNKECQLDGSGDIGFVSIRQFFYDAYSKCINGSIFDGLKMNLVSYAEELLDSDFLYEQTIGVSILKKFAENMQVADDTLRKIGTSTSVIERLIEMLNWKDPTKKYIRFVASVIVWKLVETEQNAQRVAAIPGSMESIASLLHTWKGNRDGRPYEASSREVEDHELSAFPYIGLHILEELARDHEICWKIGNARGLLARIVDLTSFGEPLQCVISMRREWRVKRALKLVKILICTTGETGKMLQGAILEIVNLLSYVKELLQYGEHYPKLQVLGMEILTILGMNEEAREKIGATGSMMRLILKLYFRPIEMEDETVCNAAGKALALLTLESKWNCERMLRVEGNVARRLVHELTNSARALNAAMILRSLCVYSAQEQSSRLQIVAMAMPMVLKTIMEENEEKEKLLEVSVGLAQEILKFLDPQVSANKFNEIGIRNEDFVGKLVEILRRYKNPDINVPRMRWFVIKLAITLMKRECKYIELFRDLRMKEVLEQTAETTSELEWFNVLSRSHGLGCHEETISSLVDKALKLLARGNDHTTF